jgi:very-long-chain enoyl-CoA reductase
MVSCPNYFFETLAWLVVAVLTNSWAGTFIPHFTFFLLVVLILFMLSPAWLFLVVSAGQMTIWAGKKHRNYKKEFGKEYPRNRKAMIPFVF